jgi:hypothetical protein
MATAVSTQANQVVRELSRKLGIQFKNLVAQVPHARTYFKLDGDLIRFDNTVALSKDVHRFMTRARDLVRQVVPLLRKAADDLDRAGRTLMVLLVSRGAEGLTSPDPTVAQLARTLGHLGAADFVGTVSGELSALLRKAAKRLEDKGRDLDCNEGWFRFKFVAVFSYNAFNWKTRRFQASGIHLVSRAANAHKLNPMIASVEAKFRHKAPTLKANYFVQFLLTKMTEIGLAALYAGSAAAILGVLWDELTMQNL